MTTEDKIYQVLKRHKLTPQKRELILNDLMKINKPMTKLHLTKKELEQIGFKEYTSKKDDLNPERKYFKINGGLVSFYYNPNKYYQVWFQRVYVGDTSFDIPIDIETKEELFTVLKVFVVVHERI